MSSPVDTILSHVHDLSSFRTSTYVCPITTNWQLFTRGDEGRSFAKHKSSNWERREREKRAKILSPSTTRSSFLEVDRPRPPMHKFTGGFIANMLPGLEDTMGNRLQEDKFRT